MDSSFFDYFLPKERIAQIPATPRESGRLMVINKNTGSLLHKTIGDFPDFLEPTDVLVINNSKVFSARLMGTVNNSLSGTKKNVEILLIKPQKSVWQAIGKPGKTLLPGTNIVFYNVFSGTIIKKNTDGTLEIDFKKPVEEIITLANTYGSVPLPPYIRDTKDASSAYQTSYAKITGSVAAPTAGFHLTSSLLQRITHKGITIVEITLHVGLGTFLPIKSPSIEAHTMHTEWVEISDVAANIISKAKQEQRRIVAVGTTTTRALEGAIQIQNSKIKTQNVKHTDHLLLPTKKHSTTILPYTGDVNIFITPGFQFQIVDCLLTNFHLPQSTLLQLVSAFSSRDIILHSYNEAIRNTYRFYSFGDAMFLTFSKSLR